MKVIAIQPVFYKSKLWSVGEEFILEERKGFKKDGAGKLIPVTLSVEDQYSSYSMKKYDEYVQEETAAPKKRGRPFGTKVEGSNLEVI